MKKQNTAQTIGGLVILACVLLFLFFRMSQSLGNQTEQQKEQTEVEKLATYDMENNYPKTVRDVIKLYTRYLKCLYNEKLSDEDIEALNKKMRELYCEKLKNYNDESAQLVALKTEIATYRKDETTMIGYTMSEASQIEYEKIDEVEFAKLDVIFNMKVKTVPINKSEEFVLEQDAFGRWKIYGWTINTNDNNIESGD